MGQLWIGRDLTFSWQLKLPTWQSGLSVIAVLMLAYLLFITSYDKTQRAFDEIVTANMKTFSDINYDFDSEAKRRLSEKEDERSPLWWRRSIFRMANILAAIERAYGELGRCLDTKECTAGWKVWSLCRQARHEAAAYSDVVADFNSRGVAAGTHLRYPLSLQKVGTEVCDFEGAELRKDDGVSRRECRGLRNLVDETDRKKDDIIVRTSLLDDADSWNLYCAKTAENAAECTWSQLSSGKLTLSEVGLELQHLAGRLQELQH